MSIPQQLKQSYWDELLALRAGVRKAAVIWQTEGEPLFTHDPTDTENALPCPILMWIGDGNILYHTPVAPCKQTPNSEWTYVQVDGKPLFYGEEPSSEEFVEMCANFIKRQMSKDHSQ